MIDTNKLPREIKDRLELKQEADPTFYRAVEEDYTNEFISTLQSRADLKSSHSYIASVFGSQGCHLKGTKLFVKRSGLMSFLSIEDIVVGDEVISILNGSQVWRRVSKTWHYKNAEVLNLKFKCGHEVNVTPEHKLFTIKKGFVEYIKAKDALKKRILFWQGDKSRIIKVDEKDYAGGIIRGAYIADGSGEGNISKEDLFVKDYLMLAAQKAGIVAKRRKRGIGVSKSVNLKSLGMRSNKFIRTPQNMSFWKGVLDGYILCDSGVNISYSSHSPRIEVKFVSKSNDWIDQLSMLLLYFYGLKSFKSSRILKSGKWKGNRYNSLLLPAQDARRFLDRFSWLSGTKSKVNGFVGRTSMQKDARSCYDKLPFDGWGIDFKGFSSRKNKRVRQIMRSINRCKKNRYIQKESILCWMNKSKIFKNAFSSHMGLFDSYWSSDVVSVNKKKSDVYDIEVEQTHNYVLPSGVLSSNSGKSYLSMASCAVLDKKFSVDNIFFDYNDLVYARRKLKPNTAVLVDEQSESYGVDSHRVNIILSALKEQLRKKSIHFFFCSPTLKPEYETSMYVIETMFIDYEENM